MGISLKFCRLENRLNDVSVFVENHPKGNIFQTVEMFEVHQKTKNHDPFCFGVTDQHDNILGVLSGVILINYFWPFSKFTARAIIQGGPLIVSNDVEILRFLLLEFARTMKKKAIYSQFRNMWDSEIYKNEYNESRFEYKPHLNILVYLNGGVESVAKRISKNKRRNVTKTTNKGTVFRLLTTYSEYKSALSLIYSTYKRVGLPIADISFFEAAYKVLFPKDRMKIFVAKFNDEVIGIRIELVYKDMIYDWYAGSDDNHRNKYVNDFLLYQILKWGANNHYHTFDLGGAGKPDIPYGVRNHKMKFGGHLLEFGRFENTHQKKMYTIAKIGFEMLRKFK